MAVRCRSCGAELAPGDLFCGECGTKVVRPPRHPRFEAVERRFFTLRGKHASGLLSDEEYEAALKELVIQDDEGRSWMIGAETGQWYYHDGQNWVAGEPPGPPGPPAPPTPAAPPPPRRRSPLLLAAGVAGIAILLCLGSIPIVWLAVPRATPPPETPGSAAVVTETPAPAPTPTPLPSPTPTPTPTPSPTPTATPSPQVALLYSDDFSDPSSGWYEFSDEDVEKGYSDGEYYLLVKKPDLLAWGFAHRTFTDFRLEVDARKVAGPDDNEFGVIVRYRDSDNFYVFEISSDGYYGVWKQVNGEWETLEAWNPSPHINQGESSNHLTLIAQGPNFSFWVNGEHLVDVTDASFSEGDIGLYAGTFDEAGVRIHFDNLEVWPPASSPDVEATPTPTTPAATPTATSPPTPPSTWTPTPVPPTPVPTPTATTAPASVGCPGPWGNLIFFDDFGSPQSGWPRYRGEEYEHYYENGEFHFAVWRTNSTGNAWIQIGALATHYRIEVKGWKVGGPDMNNYGLLFGGMNDKNYYTFRISDSGSYRVAKMVGGQWVELVPWTETPFVNKGALNFLGVRVEGTQITVCVNGQALTTVNDPALKSGRVGMVAGAYDEPAHIHFDDFSVWKFD